MKRVAIYGKGGIGKSTTSSNISAAVSTMGEKVAQIGCDPKRDSVANLIGGKLLPTILDMVSENPRITPDRMDAIMFEGFNGVLCAEAGGPRPGSGCAGKGVFLALQNLDKFKVLERKKITFVLYDVLGDTVCGGFAQPVRAGYAESVYVVTNGEPLSLFQTNNIAAAVANNAKPGGKVGLAGLINNMRGFEGEREFVDRFAERLGVPVIHHVPRSPLIQQTEFDGKTIIEVFPDSEMAESYRELGRKILKNEAVYQPNILDLKAIKEIMTEMREAMRAASTSSAI